MSFGPIRPQPGSPTRPLLRPLGRQCGSTSTRTRRPAALSFHTNGENDQRWAAHRRIRSQLARSCRLAPHVKRDTTVGSQPFVHGSRSVHRLALEPRPAVTRLGQRGPPAHLHKASRLGGAQPPPYWAAARRPSSSQCSGQALGGFVRNQPPSTGAPPDVGIRLHRPTHQAQASLPIVRRHFTENKLNKPTQTSHEGRSPRLWWFRVLRPSTERLENSRSMGRQG